MADDVDGDDAEFGFPLGPCPGCGSEDYEYDEIGILPARKCQGCGALIAHHALGPTAPDLEEDPRGETDG